jgi:hypothetical protein
MRGTKLLMKVFILMTSRKNSKERNKKKLIDWIKIKKKL